MPPPFPSAPASGGAWHDPSVALWLQAASSVEGFVFQAAPRSAARLLGQAHTGTVSVLRLEVMGQGSLALQAEEDCLLLGFHGRGVVAGHCERRPVLCAASALSFVQFPRESLWLEFRSPSSELIWMRMSYLLFQQILSLYDKEPLTPAALQAVLRQSEYILLPMFEPLLRQVPEAEAAISQPALQALESSVMATILRLIPDLVPAAHQAQALPADIPASSPKTLYERALQFMAANLQRSLDLPTIASACGASRRSVQLAFQNGDTLTPMQRLRQLRLEALRSLLLQGRSVAEACSDVGLPATGRTAGLYRELFRESPSETRRSAVG